MISVICEILVAILFVLSMSIMAYLLIDFLRIHSKWMKIRGKDADCNDGDVE